jgi:hypothetical protein
LKYTRTRFVIAFSAIALGCGSSGASGAGGTPSNTDAGPAPTTCADVAADLCSRAVACGPGGIAPVQLTSIETIDYQSLSYCTSTFTTQCGPQAPASDVPLVRDPVACGQALASATCVQGGHSGALGLPAVCGGM